MSDLRPCGLNALMPGPMAAETSPMTPTGALASPAVDAGSDVQRLWRRYSVTRDPRVRDKLVLVLSPLVRHVVHRKLRELPAHCEADDLQSAGLVALIECVERYDPAKGASLEQYAWTRVRGAIIDELRRADWAPRSVRRFEREAATAAQQLTVEHGRAPTAGELAGRLGVDELELIRRRDEARTSTVGSLNVAEPAEEGGEIEPIDVLASDDESLQPETGAMARIGHQRLRAAVASLPPRQREVLALVHLHGMSLREAGERLGVTPSRVCQIAGQSRRSLRDALGGDAELFSRTV